MRLGPLVLSATLHAALISLGGVCEPTRVGVAASQGSATLNITCLGPSGAPSPEDRVSARAVRIPAVPRVATAAGTARTVPTRERSPGGPGAGGLSAEALVAVVQAIPDGVQNPPIGYPVEALQHRWAGRVLLEVLVLASGECGQVRVARSSGHELLDLHAATVVQRWRFQPARAWGHPVDRWAALPVRFQIDERFENLP